MKYLTITLATIMILAVSAEAKAPKYKLTVSGTWTLVFPGEGDIKRLPTETGLGFGVVLPMDGWAWYTEMGMSTRATSFGPRPFIVTGPAMPVSKRWLISATFLYKFLPGYEDGAKHNHLIGGALITGYKISDSVSAILVVGPSKVVGGAWSLAIVPKLSFSL